MAQTERTYAQVLALLADQTAGGISPQDVRDAIASLTGYGGMVLSVAGAPAVMTGVGTGFSLVDIFDVITAQSSDVNAGGIVADIASTYDLVLTSGGIYKVSFSASFSSSSNNVLVNFRPHLNGSPGLIEVDRFLGTGSDTGVVAFNGILAYAPGDTIDIRVAVDSGTANLTFLAASFNAHRVG